MNYETAKQLLNKYDQGHILKFYDELTETERSELLKQIEDVDFSLLENLDAEKNFLSTEEK